MLAAFLVRLNQIQPVRRSVAHIFEPASERGQRGVDELHKQSVNLFAFQKLPKDVYDEQVGFNMLARYGSEAGESMESIETRIDKHLATLLSINGDIPLPSIRLIQAPVFHGYSISLWVEFENNPGVAAFEQALGTQQIDVRGGELDPPHVAGMAGQSGMAVGSIAVDRNDSHAAWFWLVADNFRIMAENAVAVAQSLTGQTGTAKPE
jgi:aspartate-semialdehyde dehydrogenase